MEGGGQHDSFSLLFLLSLFTNLINAREERNNVKRWTGVLALHVVLYKP